MSRQKSTELVKIFPQATYPGYGLVFGAGGDVDLGIGDQSQRYLGLVVCAIWFFFSLYMRGVGKDFGDI